LRVQPMPLANLFGETPTEVGPPSLTTKFSMSCQHYSTKLASWCKPKQNPRRGPGWQAG
jgi:hypothetical protein